MTRMDRLGVALIVTLFALVLFTAILTATYLISGRGLRAGRAAFGGAAALYAAEAGLSVDPEIWSSGVLRELTPGGTEILASARLPAGAGYTTQVTRLDDGSDSTTAYFLLRSIGRAPPPARGLRDLGILLRRRLRTGLCCEAALVVNGDLALEGAARISGQDASASVSAPDPLACEGAPVGDLPDLLVGEDPADVDPAARALSAARELLTEAEAGPDGPAADIDLPPGAVLTGLRPALAGPACARGRPTNWGAPTDPGHPCSAYIPVVRARGDLTLGPGGAGQAVLLVNGDLYLRGDLELYGIVLIRGRLLADGPGLSVVGGVIALGDGGTGHRLSGDVRVDYGRCPAWRAVRESRLGLPKPLARRAWVGLLR